MLKKLISFAKQNKALDVVTNTIDPTSFFKTLMEVYKEGKKTDLGQKRRVKNKKSALSSGSWTQSA